MLNGSGGIPGPPATAPMTASPGMAMGGLSAPGLCAGTGTSLEKNGILAVLRQAISQMPASGKPQLSMVLLVSWASWLMMSWPSGKLE